MISYYDQIETLPGPTGEPVTVRTISAMRGSVFGSVTVSPDCDEAELELALRLAEKELQRQEASND